MYYLEEDYDIEEVQYITGKAINLMQNDLVIYYEFAIENAENKENQLLMNTLVYLINM